MDAMRSIRKQARDFPHRGLQIRFIILDSHEIFLRTNYVHTIRYTRRG